MKKRRRLRKSAVLIILLIAVLISAALFFLLHKPAPVPYAASVRDVNFDQDWLFTLADPQDGADPALDDSSWQSVTLPHDWAITQSFTTAGEAESGFLPGGIGWYRRHFTVPEEWQDQEIILDFGGIYMNCDVYVNGAKLAYHPYGYTSFAIDLSDHLNMEGDNVIAVRVDHSVASSRWYSGSGIFRHVTISALNPVHIGRYGIKLTNDANTALQAEITLDNHSGKDHKTEIVCRLRTPDGKTAAEATQDSFAAKTNNPSVCTLTLIPDDIRLWSPDDPYLYTVETDVLSDGQLLDHTETPFGFRETSFDPSSGFTLNGQSMKLQGVCLHHDQGALGAVEDETALARQLDLLKDMGVNAIRSTHNPASDTLRRLCDEKGFLLIEEAFDTWLYSKSGNFYDYGVIFKQEIAADNTILGTSEGELWAEYDVREMVRRARSSPSVLAWSIGNELMNNHGGDTSEYPYWAEEITKWILAEDSSRPVTVGDNNTLEQSAHHTALDETLAANNGIIGLNYAHDSQYDSIHANHPEWCLYGSETASAYSSRSTWYTDGIDRRAYEITSYDNAYVEWGSSAEQAWKDIITRDYVAGEFIWTGFDYIGEPEPWNGHGTGSVSGDQPLPKSSYFGVIDTAGFVKDSYYFYRSQWNRNDTTLHILPDWNEEDIMINPDGMVKVIVYSNAPSVELFLNGESLGRKSYETKTTALGYTWRECEGHLYYTWNVPYTSGTLQAIGYDDNDQKIENTTGRSTVSTYGTPAVLVLNQTTPAVENKPVYVEIILQDEAGNECTGAADHLQISAEGAVILGTDNGDPADIDRYVPEDPYYAERNLFRGHALVILQKTGTDAIIRVSTGNLQAELSLKE